MKMKDLAFKVQMQCWAVSYEFNRIGTEIKIVTTNYSEAYEWCSNNMPLELIWSIEMDN